MNANNPEMLIQSLDIHALSDAELEDVNGGFWAVLAMAVVFVAAAGLAYWAITHK